MGEQKLLGHLEDLGAFAELLHVDATRTEFINEKKGLDLEAIADHAESYFDELKNRFSKLPHKVADAAMRFTSDVYLSYLDSEFVDTQPEGSTIYSPDTLVYAARNLTLEFGNLGQITQFYAGLEDSLKISKRFMYKLITGDIPKIWSQVKEGENYSGEKFGRFVLDVIEKATNLSRTGDTDKGESFQNEFDGLVRTYFHKDVRINDSEATRVLDMDILESYANQGTVAGVKAFQKDYGELIYAKWSSQPDGRNRQISYNFVIPNDNDKGGTSFDSYRSRVNLEGVKISPQVKNLLLAIGDVTAGNLRKRGMLGGELTDTIAYKNNVAKHL